MKFGFRKLIVIAGLLAAPTALLAQTGSAGSGQACPTGNLLYWQAFPPGGESDVSARHQQVVLKKRCPAIETIIQYKPGGAACCGRR